MDSLSTAVIDWWSVFNLYPRSPREAVTVLMDALQGLKAATAIEGLPDEDWAAIMRMESALMAVAVMLARGVDYSESKIAPVEPFEVDCYGPGPGPGWVVEWGRTEGK